MAALSHDGYWPFFSLLALSGAVVLALLGILRLARLRLRSRSLRLAAKAATGNGGSFAVQENIERRATG